MMDYQKLRQRAIEALIYAGVRVPTQRQIAIYMLYGKVITDANSN